LRVKLGYNERMKVGKNEKPTKLPQGGQLQRKIRIEWSPNFAYAVGLLTADGHLSKDERHIIFTSKELELINLFKAALQIENKPTRRKEKRREWFSLSFGDRVFYRFLLTIGLTPAKSKTIKSVDIPEKFFADFLRGLFDGDGTFYMFRDARWPNSLCFKMSFASASKEFIEWLKHELTRSYGVKGYLHKGAGVSNLEYVKGDSRILFHTMYHQKELLFLKRKYTKMRTALELDEQNWIPALQKHQRLKVLPG